MTSHPIVLNIKQVLKVYSIHLTNSIGESSRREEANHEASNWKTRWNWWRCWWIRFYPYFEMSCLQHHSWPHPAKHCITCRLSSPCSDCLFLISRVWMGVEAGRMRPYQESWLKLISKDSSERFSPLSRVRTERQPMVMHDMWSSWMWKKELRWHWRQ